MRYRPALLQTTAAIAWGTTIIGAFTGYDDHPGFGPLDERIWTINACVAVTVTVVGLLASQVGNRIDTAYAAMARSFITRPAEPRTATGPLPLIGARTPPGPEPGLRALNGGLHKPHGRHANPR